MQLVQSFRAMFNTESGKSDTVANVLIERALRGAYLGSREWGERGSDGRDSLIHGQLFLFDADESTYTLRPEVEAFVLKLDHDQRLADYAEFDNIDTARLYLVANSL